MNAPNQAHALRVEVLGPRADAKAPTWIDRKHPHTGEVIGSERSDGRAEIAEEGIPYTSDARWSWWTVYSGGGKSYAPDYQGAKAACEAVLSLRDKFATASADLSPESRAEVYLAELVASVAVRKDAAEAACRAIEAAQDDAPSILDAAVESQENTEAALVEAQAELRGARRVAAMFGVEAPQ
jgi:hypothetical protein